MPSLLGRIIASATRGEGTSDTVTARVLSPPRTLDWLVILRWHAVGAQLALVAVARAILGAGLPTGAMLCIVTTVAGSNLLLRRYLRRRGSLVERRWVSGVLCLDVVALTALLALSGGGSGNPCAMAYLVLVLVAALALAPLRALLILALACTGYAFLVFVDARSASITHPALTWLAFAVAGAVVAAVVTRFATALREHWTALEAAKALSTRARTLASLGNLAAGAAHELNTPLGTIAIVANELSRVIGEDPAQAIDDAYVIRDEVERCRTIVQRLAARSTEQVREEPREATGERIRSETTAMLPYGDTDRVAWSMPDGGGLRLPGEGLTQSLASLVTNALHATSDRRGRVLVTMAASGENVRFTVVDDGPGISPLVRGRLGEPFVTTKPPGRGMGLGIFLCQSFADAWGGALQFEDNLGRGTRVVLEIPRRCTVEARIT